MSKFNTSNSGMHRTTNRSGCVAYDMSKREQFVTAVLTTMFGEPKFYGSTDDDIIKLATEFAHIDPEFLCKVAIYARTVGNMRSVSHVLAAVIARHAKEYTRAVIRNIVVRPDDILEIMACYKQLYGKPFPNALKRQIAKTIQKFDEYSIAKYNGGNKSITFKDVLRITHPTPNSDKVSELFNKIINDNLETPYTWETELSAKGNTKEVWDKLIQSGKLGYMAMLRNLNNMIKVDADITPVLEKISNEEEVKKSKQLPFRFYSAYKRLRASNYLTQDIENCLNNALMASTNNIETIPGRTLIAVDVSGSMTCNISSRSEVTCRDIAVLLGAMASRICEDATTVYFSSEYWSSGSGYTVCHYGKYDSILANVKNAPLANGGTDMQLPFKWALNEDTGIKPFDRVIYFSDNESNCQSRPIQSLADKYRREKNPDLWVHAVDLQGYGTQQFIGSKFNLIAGWGESVLKFINYAEDGFKNLLSEIENIEVK